MADTLIDPVGRLSTALAGRYTVERVIGRGGMATVYLARDLRHGRPVAVKVLRQELAAAVGAARFLREIAIAAELQHPNILPLLDSGEADGLLYYVMPYVEGDSLRIRLDRMRQLTIDEALRVTCEVADALDYAHRHGVVHRDVKPENVLLEDGHAVIADFGIARALGGVGPDTLVATLTATGVAVGTPAYMSPEQAAGGHDMDGRSDVYSLGCLLYELLAGQPPFHGPTVESVVRQHLTAPPPSVRMLRPAAPAYVEAAVTRALAKAPADRFQTAAELREALRQSGAGQGASPHREDRGAPTTRESTPRRVTEAPMPRTARRYRAASMASVLVALSLAGYWTLSRWRGPRAIAPAPATEVAPTTPRWVLVADFDSPPDDRTVGIAVRELASAVLDESKLLATVPPDHLQSARRAALLADTATLTADRAKHLAYRTAVRTVVEGRVDRVGADSYSIVVRAVGVPDGRVIVAARGSAREDSVIPVTERLARRVGAELGARVDAEMASAAPSSEVVTPSFAAYRKYTEAVDRNLHNDFAAARTLAREAVALDPDFARAWAFLGGAYENLALEDSARLAYAEARRRPGRLTALERLELEADIANERGDVARELQLLDRAIQESPSSAPLHYGRAYAVQALGRYDEASESFRRAIELSPLAPPPKYVDNYSTSLAALGQIAEALALRKGRPSLLLAVPAAVTAADWAQVETLATVLESDPRQILRRRAYAAMALASSHAARGRMADADRSLLRASSLLQTSAFGAAVERTRLLLAAASDRPPDPRSHTPARDTTTEWLIARALRAAIAGDTASSVRLLRSLRARGVPESSPVMREIELVGAWIAVRGKRWAETTRILGPPAWRGVPGMWYTGSLDMRRWLVGEAYHRLGRPDSAAAYLQLLVTPTRTTWEEQLSRGLVYPFAHRRLAQLHTQLGRPDKARHHWQTFLGTFTEPDPEYRPLVEEAKRQLELLR